MSGASSINFYRSPAVSCSTPGRTSPFLVASRHAHHFLRTSLVGSITVSMTYSINVQPYNDPYVKIAEEAFKTTSEPMIPGAFLVDIIPILKYVPEWFPGAKFQSKAAMIRKQCAILHLQRQKNWWYMTRYLSFLGFLIDDTYTFPGQRWLWSLVRHRGTKRDPIFQHP